MARFKFQDSGFRFTKIHFVIQGYPQDMKRET